MTLFRHDTSQRTAILLVNLGTPDHPTPAAVRRYLRQFLTDPRVVDLPPLLWRPLLELFILPRRGRQSAAKYAAIWSEAGSPLAVTTAQLARQLIEHFPTPAPEIDYAMRYGQPAIPNRLQQLRARGLRRLLLVPLYPQYCSATTASVFDAVVAELSRWRDLPEIRFLRSFHDHPRWIARVAATIEEAFRHEGVPEILLFTFHGMPQKSLLAGDPYHCECHKSARLIAEALSLPSARWQLSFQSRFGAGKWLQPSTEQTLLALARKGIKHIAVVAPGFLVDCLETLHEIAIEYRHLFLTAGGTRFTYIPCLNADPQWAADLAAILQPHLSGWPSLTPDEPAELAARCARAQALGAHL
ncbi:MAG: ferrochelatase [Hydrogenophilus sp.]|nr:ferrochelatase [Hydrogenophilus sp.]